MAGERCDAASSKFLLNLLDPSVLRRLDPDLSVVELRHGEVLAELISKSRRSTFRIRVSYPALSSSREAAR
jgi:hypothetical protein